MYDETARVVFLTEMDKDDHGPHHCRIGRCGESDIDLRVTDIHQHSTNSRLVKTWDYYQP